MKLDYVLLSKQLRLFRERLQEDIEEGQGRYYVDNSGQETVEAACMREVMHTSDIIVSHVDFEDPEVY